LDVTGQNAEILSLSWRFDGQTFVTIDLNQNIKIWSMKTDPLQQHLQNMTDKQ
jgi:hypothetical protein